MTINRDNLPLAMKSKDAVFLLGISTRRLRQLTKEGEIRGFQCGGVKRPRYLYRTKDLLAWLELKQKKEEKKNARED